MSDDTPTAAEALAEMTGRPVEEFRADGYEIPKLEEQEMVPVDEFDCPCGCTGSGGEI